MISLLGYVKLLSGGSREEFQKWWVEKHAPYVKENFGIRRYVVHLAQKGFAVGVGSVTGLTDEPEFDGLAELWFDDLESMLRFWNSPKGGEGEGSSGQHTKYGANDVAVVVGGPEDRDKSGRQIEYAIKYLSIVAEPHVIVPGP